MIHNLIRISNRLQYGNETADNAVRYHESEEQNKRYQNYNSVRACKDLRWTAVRAKAVSSLGDGKRSKCFKFRFEEKIKK